MKSRFDRAIRAALNDVVATAPHADDFPVLEGEGVAPAVRRRPWLAVATGLTAAAGIIAVVVVTTRSTITTDVSRPSVPVVTTTPAAPTTTVPVIRTTVAQTPGPLQRIEFRSGTNNTRVATELEPGTTDRYVLEAGAEQTMIVHVDSAVPDITFSIFGPDGAQLAENEVLVAVELPADGDYVVEVQTDNIGGEYEIDFLIN